MNPMNCMIDCSEETRKKCSEVYWRHLDIIRGIVDNLAKGRIHDPDAIKRARKVADSYTNHDWMRYDCCLLQKQWEC